MGPHARRDTLWIDTNRGLCTLTWRGQIPLHARDQEGTIAIAAEEANRPPRKPSADDPRSSVDEGPDFSHTMVDEDAVAMAFAAPKPALPFAGRLSPFTKPSVAAPSAPQPVLPVPFSDEGAAAMERRRARVVTRRRDAAPAWLPVAAAAVVPHAAPTLDVVGAPAELPPRPPLLHTPPSAPLPPAPIEPLAWPSERLGPPSSAPSATRLPASLYDASNAAAGEAPSRLPPSEVAPPSLSSSSLSPRALVELVWYDPTKIGTVRKVPAWEPLLAKQPKPAALNATPPEAAGADADAAAAAEKAQRERGDVHVVLVRATPITNVEAALFNAAAEDGSLAAPLVVTAGELELGLDEVKMLEAMIGAAAAFAPATRSSRRWSTSPARS